KCNPERYGGRGISEVVDQIGKQRDAAGGDEDDGLGERGQTEDRKRDSDGLQPLAGAHDAPVDETVRVAGLMVMLGLVAVRPRVRVSMRRSVAVTVQITAQ